MTHALTILKTALATAEHNEPIQRAEGRTEEADLNLAKAADLRQGIAALTLVAGGLIVIPREVEHPPSDFELGPNIMLLKASDFEVSGLG